MEDEMDKMTGIAYKLLLAAMESLSSSSSSSLLKLPRLNVLLLACATKGLGGSYTKRSSSDVLLVSDVLRTTAFSLLASCCCTCTCCT